VVVVVGLETREVAGTRAAVLTTATEAVDTHAARRAVIRAV